MSFEKNTGLSGRPCRYRAINAPVPTALQLDLVRFDLSSLGFHDSVVLE
ncbi:hypothetical protein RSSM_06591 [Rhodopirellula sallentina SM41]|uniref:Uncharacterized protein n=1 Tax=Rhodopirellula sallentina SM41 TaxID=1263870 RepID=M5U7M7_9BACT|nr:hypothetical protein RSSM_06591 [Rhodopirellula sallentina SM41]